jgi:hypothetical protein
MLLARRAKSSSSMGRTNAGSHVSSSSYGNHGLAGQYEVTSVSSAWPFHILVRHFCSRQNGGNAYAPISFQTMMKVSTANVPEWQHRIRPDSAFRRSSLARQAICNYILGTGKVNGKRVNGGIVIDRASHHVTISVLIRHSLPTSIRRIHIANCRNVIYVWYVTTAPLQLERPGS